MKALRHETGIGGSRLRKAVASLLCSFPLIAVAADALLAGGEPLSAWQKHFRGQVDEYRITLRGDKSRELKPQVEPLLRWSQPVRGGDDGAVYLWLDGERPAAIVSILAWPHPEGAHVVQHEWHSLADAPLTADYRGNVNWHPEKAGVEWKALKGAPAPAATASGRALQMRNLARRFSGYCIDDFGGDERWDFRLLAQPLHKFDRGDAPSGDAPVAGGLFALVQGTDPEVLILLEAQPGSPAGWRYALARFCDRPLHVALDGEEVLNLRRDPLDRRESPYVSIHVERRQPPDELAKPTEPGR